MLLRLEISSDTEVCLSEDLWKHRAETQNEKMKKTIRHSDSFFGPATGWVQLVRYTADVLDISNMYYCLLHHLFYPHNSGGRLVYLKVLKISFTVLKSFKVVFNLLF